MQPLEQDCFFECLQGSNLALKSSLVLHNFRVWGFGLMLNLKKCRIINMQKGSVVCNSKDAMAVLECSASLKPSYTTCYR